MEDEAHNAHTDSVDGNNILDRRVSFRLVQAIPAALVKRPKGVGVEARDVVLATEGVVLEDLNEVSYREIFKL